MATHTTIITTINQTPGPGVGAGVTGAGLVVGAGVVAGCEVTAGVVVAGGGVTAGLVVVVAGGVVAMGVAGFGYKTSKTVKWLTQDVIVLLTVSMLTVTNFSHIPVAEFHQAM
jgi:hypothetical protein